MANPARNVAGHSSIVDVRYRSFAAGQLLTKLNENRTFRKRPVADVPLTADKRRMIYRFLAPLLLLTGCGKGVPEGPVQRIEIRQSGWESIDIVVTRSGSGSFELSGLAPEPITGTFRVTPQEFINLEARISEFRKSAVPRTDATIEKMVNRRCPQGVPYVTDNGAIYVRWIGNGFDQHYLAELGCDSQRNADRNAKLIAVVRSLPVPIA